jgi:hypothetical protein
MSRPKGAMIVEPPGDLAQWTFDTVVDVVTQHDYEPDRYDYKTVLNPTHDKGRDAHVSSVRRTASALANTSGGVILFGIRDRQERVADLQDRIVGIPLDGDLRKHVGDKLKAIDPPISFDFSAIPLVANGTLGIVAVHVPPSLRRPHMYEGTFYGRTAGGTNSAMSVMEVREQMLNTAERLRKVTLLRLELIQCRELAKTLGSANDGGIGALERFDLSAFKVLLADICALVPSDDLLWRLLQIPSAVSGIHRQYDRISPVGSPPIPLDPTQMYLQRPLIVAPLMELARACDDAEREFAAVFGPVRAGPNL